MNLTDAISFDELLFRRADAAMRDLHDVEAQAERLAAVASEAKSRELRDLRAELESLRIGLSVVSARFEPVATTLAPQRRTLQVQRTKRQAQRPAETRKAPARAVRRGGLQYGSLTHPCGEEVAAWPEQAA